MSDPGAQVAPSHFRDSPPSPWVRRFAALIPKGTEVLDLASGAGRHTRLLIGLGHKVTAVDRDIALLGETATDPRVAAIAADLEDGSPWHLGARQFGGVIVTCYLHRPILPRIVGAVAPGGVLIYETFALGNERFGRPNNPEFLLRPGELLEAVAGKLAVVAYEAGEEDRPKPGVRQRIAAINASSWTIPPPG
jgi:SAM-dependent methyltransferase